MKTFKEFLTAKGITKEQFEAKDSNEMAALYNEYNEAEIKTINESVGANKQSIKDIPSIDEALKDFVKNDEEFKKVSKLVKEIQEKVNQLKDNAKGDPDTVKTLVSVIREKKDEIKEMLTSGTKKEVVIKALSNLASITNNTTAVTVDGIGQLGRVARSLYNIFPKFPVADGDNRGTVRYWDWDEATTVKAAAMVAEGGTYPESTAKFQEYTLPLKKIGDQLPVTEEFGEDAASAAAELDLFLATNVESLIDDQLVNGDGLGNNIKGLIASVPTYTAPTSGITGANIYDLVKKVKTDIVKTRGSKYMPNFVAFNSDTLDLLGLEKDLNNNYIFRNDDRNIGSMIIIEDNSVADDALVVGDSRFGRIYDKGGVVLTRGLSGTQFDEDTITIKARKRMLFLIRTVDQTGFRKVENIAASLVLLAT